MQLLSLKGVLNHHLPKVNVRKKFQGTRTKQPCSFKKKKKKKNTYQWGWSEKKALDVNVVTMHKLMKTMQRWICAIMKDKAIQRNLDWHVLKSVIWSIRVTLCYFTWWSSGIQRRTRELLCLPYCLPRQEQQSGDLLLVGPEKIQCTPLKLSNLQTKTHRNISGSVSTLQNNLCQ